MTENKKHHFVPKFYLKNFSVDGKSINTHNITHHKSIPKAKLKTQCYRDYLYGKDNTIEKYLSQIEGSAAQTIRDAIDLKPPIAATPSHAHILIHIIIQQLRTTYAIDTTNEMLDKFAKHLAILKGMSPEDLEGINLELTEPGPFLVTIASDQWHLATDLKYKILVAPEAIDFITSDNPVIYYNQMFEDFDNLGSGLGIASAGLQIFYPISPKTLIIFYDAKAYKIGNKKDKVVHIVNPNDVNEINKLQVVNASENIYIYDLSRINLNKLLTATKLRPQERTKAHIQPGQDTATTRSELYVSSKNPNKINLTITCIKSIFKIEKTATPYNHQLVNLVRDPMIVDLDIKYRKAKDSGSFVGGFYEFAAIYMNSN